MKTILFFLMTMLICSTTEFFAQDMRARTLKGETVMLKKNGTWFLMNPSAQIEDTAVTFDGRVVVLRRDGSWLHTGLKRSTASIPVPQVHRPSIVSPAPSNREAERPSGETEAATGSFIGSHVPSFKYTLPSGEEIDVNRMIGKVMLINFWASWCRPCKKEMPYLEMELWRRFKDENFIMVGISSDDNNDFIKKISGPNGFTFPMYYDSDNSLTRLFNVKYIPTNFVVGKDGTIIYQSSGFGVDEFHVMTNTIEKALRE